jgi:hypothetical protein
MRREREGHAIVCEKLHLAIGGEPSCDLKDVGRL